MRFTYDQTPIDHTAILASIRSDVRQAIAEGPKRIVRSVISLLQKLRNTPLNSHNAITETELWSTYYDPVPSCLVSNPDKLVHLRWINLVPIEKGKARPDAVINEKPYLEFTASIGFGEAKVCTLRFSEGYCYLNNGVYTFVEIARLQFADSVENLPSFCTLMNVKKLLAINNVFWRYCKESA
ncbi:hypothetical protein G6F42_012000 [Rhizopus arrhizus]|nr:hypothetical protein G6F42_012000 [Rhizopus arrhizus]